MLRRQKHALSQSTTAFACVHPIDGCAFWTFPIVVVKSRIRRIPWKFVKYVNQGKTKGQQLKGKIVS